MVNRDYFVKELEDIREVPTLPQVAFQLIALISDEKSSMREISNLIEDDPPLVAKILRIVNSGYYHLRNDIKNIRQAVVILGLEELRNVIFALSVFSTFYHVKESEYFSFLRFWKHSAATGKIAVAINKYLGIELPHSTFISGLLHDFGRLILQLYFREEYEKVFAHCISNNRQLVQAEKEVMGFGHDEAGYWLAQKWNLPDYLSDIILNHHQIRPGEVAKNPLLAIIHIADRITNIWGIGIEPMPVMEMLEENPIWLELQQLYPRLQTFPLEEMTRVFDMHLEEAETFVEHISQMHQVVEDAV
ncbi:MAG: hypothetical protein Kow0042_17610 [Calditrichia bacterium]